MELLLSVIDQDPLVTYKFEFSSVNSGEERRLIVLWELNELLSSSYATSRTLAIVNLEFVYRGKVASCALFSQRFPISKHLLPNLTDPSLFSVDFLLFEITPVFG